ncbi:UDP-glucuronosyltransferase [Paenibacillus maysiensis]|uniref:UDP-glucuronosyltransferase n=1 Tax=Paenibacillus maysiensis TaxID=1155954 RepID=UPI0004AD5F7B|nr:UDP-glucuronosyltransferase [Paenibacillus maysiensis]
MSESMHKGMHESMLITILCSGFGLGFYTPGLLMQAGLRRLGVETAIHVFENVLPESARLKVDKSRKAYHDNFAVALMSQKVPQDMRNSLDLAALEVLLTRWMEEDRRHFICLSGHWMYVLEEYRKRREPGSIHVDIVYMDSTPSPSWKNLAKHNPHFADGCGETTFFENDQNRISHYIDVPAVEHVPFEARQSRLFVHGGGWGMGTYRDKVGRLKETGWALDLLLYDQDQPDEQRDGIRYFRMDPQWRTWQRNEAGEHTFPPFGEVKAGEETLYEVGADYHGMLDQACHVQAIVSKPGGGSLTDSFATATPLIMLEPFGVHEMHNADLWERLGLGIRYDTWMQIYGGSAEILEDMHRRIVELRSQTPRYVEVYVRNTQVRASSMGLEKGS